MTTKPAVTITINGTHHRQQYAFPLRWALAVIAATTALTILGVAAIQGGWLR